MKIDWVLRVVGAALLLTTPILVASTASSAPTVAVVGTGDMGDSLGPRFAELGYRVFYGSRRPESEAARALAKRTGKGTVVTSQRDAAQSADLVVLAVPWPAMRSVAQNLGSLDGKIVIDISMPTETAEDGYERSVVETSSAEMIQGWNPGARVVKTFATVGSFVIDNPAVTGGPVTVPIAGDDRAAKEEVGRIVAAMGMDPVDAGPLRLARELEAVQRLYMVPLLQRRKAAWEIYFRRSYFWECIWEDDFSVPVADAENLAQMPAAGAAPKPCPGT